MKKIYEFITDIFMPNRCPCCSGIIRWNELVCKECIDKLPYYTDIDNIPPEGCDAAVSAFEYKEPANQGVFALKNNWGYSFAEYSANILAQKLTDCGADLITCVPMAWRKKQDRGWNQAEVISEKLSNAINIPCDFTLLSRRKSRKEQHSLKAAERAAEARKMYKVADDHNDITGKKLLLVDDIHTTGSTISACAALLRSIGASEIVSVTICRTMLDKDKKL